MGKTICTSPPVGGYLANPILIPGDHNRILIGEGSELGVIKLPQLERLENLKIEIGSEFHIEHISVLENPSEEEQAGHRAKTKKCIVGRIFLLAKSNKK